MKYDELDMVMKYSLVNMCYVNQNTFDKYLNKASSHNYIQYRLYEKGKEYYGGGHSEQFYTDDTYSRWQPNFLWHANHISVTQNSNNSISIQGLKDNQVILSKQLLTGNLNISEDDLMEKLYKGLTVHFGYDYEGEDAPAFELEVVGCLGDYSGDIIVSDNFYKNWFVGADYLITDFKNDNSDKKLISYFENFDDSVMFNIQCPATPVLDDFGGMIESMAKILLWVGVGLAVFSGLMLMNFISTSISYKKREIGVLRAIGARSKDVFSIFFSESFIICMINFLLSAIGTGVVCSIVNNAFVSKLGVSLVLMVFGFKQIALLFGVALLVAFVSSFFPVYRFAKKNPIDSINNR